MTTAVEWLAEQQELLDKRKDKLLSIAESAGVTLENVQIKVTTDRTWPNRVNRTESEKTAVLIRLTIDNYNHAVYVFAYAEKEQE